MFKGICNATQRVVAIKKMSLTENKIKLEDCLKEVEIMSSLDHPNIIKVILFFNNINVINMKFFLKIFKNEDFGCFLYKIRILYHHRV